jgi:MFS family permease
VTAGTPAEPAAEARTLRDALRDNPEWRRLYFARTASLLGNWLNTLAIVHLLGEGEVTAALPLAVVFVLKQAPVTLLGPAAGVVADRRDRRSIMIVCDLLSAAVVLGFFAVSPGDSLSFIYGLTLLQIAVTTFFDPAYRAVIPDLVQPKDLIAANAISSVTWSACFALGTALGGFVLYAFGWKVAIALDAISYVVSALLIVTVRDTRTRPPRRPRVQRPSLAHLLGWHDMVAGMRYVAKPGPVRAMLAVKPVWGAMGALTLFLTLLGTAPAHRLADSGDLGISFLWFCRAVGTGVGPLFARAYARGEPRRLRTSIAIGFVVALISYATLPLVGSWWLAGMVVFVAHLGGAAVWVMSTVLLQQLVPSELRGRTFAAELGLVMLTSSLSHLVYAALIDFGVLSLQEAIFAAAAVCSVGALLWMSRVVFVRERA